MDETPDDALTHEQKVARLLELEEAREARRAARARRLRASWPILVGVLVLAVMVGAYAWDSASKQDERTRSCEQFMSQVGRDSSSC